MTEFPEVRTAGREIGAEACRALLPGARFRLRVTGRSMEPVLLDGDEIEAERVAARELRLGDLVVVDLPDVGLVVHRLLWRSRSALRTWGDGSRRMDPPVPPDRLIGRVLNATREQAQVAGAAPMALARRLQWGRHFSAAALHRLRRRLS